MKRFFLSTITLCFFVLTVPISAQANFFPKQYETPRVFPDDSGQYLIYGNYTDCWTVNDTVYLFNEMFDAVYTWRPGQSAPALLQLDCFKELRGNHPREEFSETLRFFIFNDSFCVLDTLNSTFYRYDNNASWETLCRLDDPSSILTDIRQFRIHSLVFEKNNIFFLAPLGDWLDESLLSIDISTGELKELKAPVLQAICKYKDGYLLVNDNGRVKTYELATQMLSEDVLCVADEAPSNIFYDEPSDQIYYAYQGFLCRKSGMMQPEQIRTLSTAGTDVTLWDEEYYEKGYSGLFKLSILPNDKLALFPTNGLEYDRTKQIYIIHNTPLQEPVQTLSVYHHLDNPSTMHYLFILTHPFVRMEDWYDAKVGSEPSVYYSMENRYPKDIYTMSTEGMLQKQMLEGSIQDLFVSKNLKEEVGTYYPAVRNALETSAGLLIAIPLSMEINLWDYHADQWEALQLPNLPKTVDELIAVNDLWNAQYAEKHLLEFSDEWDRNPKRLFYAACYQYALEEATDTEPTDFNTPKFRQLATKFLSLPKRKFVYQDNSIVRCMGNSEFDPMRYRSLSYMGVNGYSPMIPPAITDAPTKIGARMNVQCLSAEAPNPELALAYLEFVMRHLPEEVTMMLSPENSMPLLISDPEALKAVVEYDTKEISSLLYHYNGEWEYAYWKESWMHAMEYFLQSIKESPYVISSSSLSLYQNIVPQLTFYTDAPPIYTYRWQDEESESLIIERLIMQLNEYSH